MKPYLIEDIWNKTAEIKLGNVNKSKPRDYISPSDLGKPFIDRYYKMKGEIPTNTFDERTLRIFDAGHLFEWIVVRSMAMAGVLKSRGSRARKNYVTVPNNSYLPVWGYYDLIIGGNGEWNKAREQVKESLEMFKLDLEEEMIETYAMKLIDGLQKEYGDKTIDDLLVDVKSINSMAFWGHNNRDEEDRFIGYEHNKLQLIPYLLGKGSEKPEVINEGALFYISKDDLCLQQVNVSLDEDELVNKFWEDVKTMTKYYREDIVPPKEEEMVYDAKSKKFNINWSVARSQYLTKIYGYKNKEELEQYWKQEILDVNRALNHLRDYTDLMSSVDKEEEDKRKLILKKLDTLDKKLKTEDKAFIKKYNLNERL